MYAVHMGTLRAKVNLFPNLGGLDLLKHGGLRWNESAKRLIAKRISARSLHGVHARLLARGSRALGSRAGAWRGQSVGGCEGRLHLR